MIKKTRTQKEAEEIISKLDSGEYKRRQVNPYSGRFLLKPPSRYVLVGKKK